jgi:hypothetical protein
MLKQGGVTCVDCHSNLVHPPAAAAKDYPGRVGYPE